MQALIVTARLRSGFAASDPWSPTLDGILAYWTMRERLGEEEFALQSARRDLMGPVEGLPLGVERHGDWWWYQCSAPCYEQKALVRRHYHRRFDAQHAERYLAAQKGRIQVKAGPYKSSRLAAQVRIAAEVRWHVIGDGEAIERLLGRCRQIGGHLGRGYGAVREWRVEPGGDEVMARAHRALPVDYAAANHIDGERLLWGLRPPTWLPCNLTECVLPHAA